MKFQCTSGLIRVMENLESHVIKVFQFFWPGKTWNFIVGDGKSENIRKQG